MQNNSDFEKKLKQLSLPELFLLGIVLTKNLKNFEHIKRTFLAILSKFPNINMSDEEVIKLIYKYDVLKMFAKKYIDKSYDYNSEILLPFFKILSEHIGQYVFEVIELLNKRLMSKNIRLPLALYLKAFDKIDKGELIKYVEETMDFSAFDAIPKLGVHFLNHYYDTVVEIAQYRSLQFFVSNKMLKIQKILLESIKRDPESIVFLHNAYKKDFFYDKNEFFYFSFFVVNLLFLYLEKEALERLIPHLEKIDNSLSLIASGFYYLLIGDDAKAAEYLAELVNSFKKSFLNKTWFRRGLLHVICILLFNKYKFNKQYNIVNDVLKKDTTSMAKVLKQLLNVNISHLKNTAKIEPIYCEINSFGDVFLSFYYLLFIQDEGILLFHDADTFKKSMLHIPYLTCEFDNYKSLIKSGKIKSNIFSILNEIIDYEIGEEHVNNALLEIIETKQKKENEYVWILTIDGSVTLHKIHKERKKVTFKPVTSSLNRVKFDNIEDEILVTLVKERNLYGFFKLLAQYDKFYEEVDKNVYKKAKLYEGKPNLYVENVNGAFKLCFLFDIFSRSANFSRLYLTNFKYFDAPDYITKLKDYFRKEKNKYCLKIKDKNLFKKILVKFSEEFQIVFYDDVDESLIEYDEKIEVDEYYVIVEKIYGEFLINSGFKPFDQNQFYLPLYTKGTLIDFEGKKYLFKNNEDRANQIFDIIEKHVKKEFYTFKDIESLLRFLSEIKKVEGINIEISKELFIKDVVKIESKDFNLKESKAESYFEIDGKVNLNDKTIEFLELIKAVSMKKDDSQFVKLKSGDYILLDDNLFEELKILAAVGSVKKDKLVIHEKLRPFLLGEKSNLLKDDDYHKKIDEINNKLYQIPEGFAGTLRGYQIDAYIWLRRMYEIGFGACLADDMGLGKTVTSIAFMEGVRDNLPFLVVAPASVIYNWKREIVKFSKNLNPILMHENNIDLSKLNRDDVLIVSYGLLINRFSKIRNIKFNVAIFDEGHLLKTHTTKRSDLAKAILANQKVILSGTPIENNLTELWNIMDIANTGLLGTFTQFKEKFLKSNEGNYNQLNVLKNVIKPFVLRRKKSDVLKELPAKTEIIIDYELSDAEKSLYQALQLNALDMLKSMDDYSKNTMSILSEIVRLKQACCHPKLVNEEVDITESSKERAFFELVEEIVDGEHKALIFSQFVKFLKIIETKLKKAGIKYVYLDGSTSINEREKAIKTFQENDDIKLFLLSLKAGGLGLNLTAADVVVHLDPWWNPAAEEQAADRAHRIGQTRPVTIYKLIAKGTLEEKIIDIQQKKKELADFILKDTDTISKLSIKELISLLN